MSNSTKQFAVVLNRIVDIFRNRVLQHKVGIMSKPSDAELTPAYDDEMSEDTLKRGQQYKWSKARKSDFDSTRDIDSGHQNNGTGALHQEEDQHVAKKSRVEESVGQSNDDARAKEPRLPKRKVAVMIGYCGTGYHGMQYNPPQPTIEAALFKAFCEAGAISQANSTDLKKNGFMRAARTDKGVHAGGNLISLKMIIEDPEIRQKINDILPEGIRVWNIERVNRAFDCRKMCSSRWYEYLLPTYSFIGPKPGSPLHQEIEKSKLEFPDVIIDDEETTNFWKDVDAEVAKIFSSEEIEEIKDYVPPSKDQFSEVEEIYQKVRQYKQLENLHRRKYRVTEKKLRTFRECMAIYLGPHNFHNFTLGKDFKDPSAVRFMKDITVSDPFVIGDAKTEWVSIKIHGQSFMLHQIRKMISMATLITRCGCPPSRIVEAYKSQKINIPKAPALGLLLESPVFDGYNKRLEKFGYNPIDFSKFQDQMDAFKMKHIYDKIYKEEVTENVFNAFFSYIDSFNRVTGSTGEESETKTGENVQKNIFEYLTAKGIVQGEGVEIEKKPSDVEVGEAM